MENPDVSSENIRASRPYLLLSVVFTLCLELRKLLIGTLEINSNGIKSAQSRDLAVPRYKIVAHWPSNLQGTKNPRWFLYLETVAFVSFGVGFDCSFSAIAWRNDHIERGHRTEKIV